MIESREVRGPAQYAAFAGMCLMNAHAERFVRSIRSECLDQMIFVGRPSLEKAIVEYVTHYHDERSHQGLGNEIVSKVPVQREGVIEASERLGGLLKHYHRRAA